MDVEELGDELKIDDGDIEVKSCRILRRQTTIQTKTICPKEERNASLRKVNCFVLVFYFLSLLH